MFIVLANTELKKDPANDNAERFRAAYQDPSNTFFGEKWEQAKKLDIADIAKLIRADIKTAIKSGDLPKGLKVSVRIHRYSLGQSIKAYVKKLPEGWLIETKEYREWKNNKSPYSILDIPFKNRGISLEHSDMMRKLEDIGNAYNRKNTDSMSDYFDVDYYFFASVSID
jgi:hypothetical protein